MRHLAIHLERKPFPLSVFAALIFSAQLSTAQAAALLKPTSGPTQTLRPRALDIRTQIDGAWAQTTVTTIYARQSKQQIEADLLYTAPEGAIITGFAYWFGNEKVVARLTEKERAAEISSAAADGDVDPAWVELIGKNVFRARLHAIKPGHDLRVEVKFAQPLQNEGTANVWKYPLVNETRDVTLDWLRVAVNATDVSKIRNNYGASVSADEISVKKYNFKPKNDVRLSLAHSAKDLTAQMSAEHLLSPGGGAADEAYFALTLQSPTEIQTAPKISGVETFDVLPAEYPSPGEIRIFGRYRGKGAATVTWGGRQAIVWFAPPSDAEHEISGLAAPLWGSRRIAELPHDKMERISAITLSKRFNILSDYTSLVAIPFEERKLLDARLQQIDVRNQGAMLGREWAIEMENKRPLSPKALQAREGLRQLERSSRGRKYGFDEESARALAVQNRVKELAHQVMERRMSITPGSPTTEARMKLLAAFGEVNYHPYLQSALQSLRWTQVRTVAARWTQQVVALQGQTPTAKKLKVQLDTLEERYGMHQDYATAAYRKAAQQMAYSALTESLAGRESAPRTTQLIDAGERFVKFCGEHSFRHAFYEPALQSYLEKARDQLLGEIEGGHDQSENALEAQISMRQIYNLAPNLRGSLRQKGSLEWEIDCARRGLAHEIAYRIALTRAERPDDKRSLDQLQSQLDRLADKTEQDSDDYISAETERLQNGEPLLSAHQFRLRESGEDDSDDTASVPTRSEPQIENRAHDPRLTVVLPADTRHVEAILPNGETQNLTWNAAKSQWETHFYGPHFEQAGRTVIALRAVDSMGRATLTTLNFTPTSSESWDLGVWIKGGAAYIDALLPWKKRVKLPCLPTGQYLSSVGVPLSWRAKKPSFQFLVGDKAGGVAQITVDWN